MNVPMTTRHRTAQHAIHKDDADAATSSLDGSWKAQKQSTTSKQNRKRVGTMSVAQAVFFAAFSASAAAVITAIGATYVISNRYELQNDAFLSSTTNTVVTRTIQSPPVRESTTHSSMGLGTTPSRSHTVSGQAPEDKQKLQKIVDGEKKVKVAWLMSFPNSGTSYTLHLTREASNTTTATNYALEGDVKDKPSIAIPGSRKEDGPFLELIPGRFTNIPDTILTKTHCGGFCATCPPVNYIETPRSFEVSCRSGRRAKMTNKGLKLKSASYGATIVTKAVHIIRHPLDNSVARFHLEYNRYRRENDRKWMADHPYNITGFQRWCRKGDGKNELKDMRWVDTALANSLTDVPCHAEFFRYVQWHNLAFSLTRDLGIPTLVIHYNDYQDDFEGTLTRLLEFLELPRVGEGIPFSSGKEYKDYYTPKQRLAVEGFVKELATIDTWRELERYSFL